MKQRLKNKIRKKHIMKILNDIQQSIFIRTLSNNGMNPRVAKNNYMKMHHKPMIRRKHLCVKK